MHDMPHVYRSCSCAFLPVQVLESLSPHTAWGWRQRLHHAGLQPLQRLANVLVIRHLILIICLGQMHQRMCDGRVICKAWAAIVCGSTLGYLWLFIWTLAGLLGGRSLFA
jgi:hypothetical protein